MGSFKNLTSEALHQVKRLSQQGDKSFSISDWTVKIKKDKKR